MSKDFAARVKAQLLNFSLTLEPTFDAVINILPPKVRPKANDAIDKVIEAAKLERSIVLLGLATVLALVLASFLLVTGTVMFAITVGVRLMYMYRSYLAIEGRNPHGRCWLMYWCCAELVLQTEPLFRWIAPLIWDIATNLGLWVMGVPQTGAFELLHKVLRPFLLGDVTAEEQEPGKVGQPGVTLVVEVVSASDLPKQGDSFMCILEFEGAGQQFIKSKTKSVQPGVRDPVWNNEKIIMRPVPSLDATLKVTIVDRKTMGDDEDVCFATFDLSDITEGHGTYDLQLNTMDNLNLCNATLNLKLSLKHD